MLPVYQISKMYEKLMYVEFCMINNLWTCLDENDIISNIHVIKIININNCQIVKSSNRQIVKLSNLCPLAIQYLCVLYVYIFVKCNQKYKQIFSTYKTPIEPSTYNKYHQIFLAFPG